MSLAVVCAPRNVAGQTLDRTLSSMVGGVVGGFSGIVMKIENEKGENLVGERANLTGVDMDGVPGGLQPSPEDKKEAENEKK